VFKKLISTTTGRVSILVAAVLVMCFIKWGCDRVIPIIVFNDVKSGKLVPARDGSLMLPWYFRFESASGCVYVTKDKTNTYVLFPIVANGESRFTGELATDLPITVGVTSPCQDKETTCESIVMPSVAADPGGGSQSQVTVTGKVADRLYAAECTAD
jgi:hypothetical protein